MDVKLPANGERYPLGVRGWTHPRNGSPRKPEKYSKNAVRTPSRVHAVLGADKLEDLLANESNGFQSVCFLPMLSLRFISSCCASSRIGDKSTVDKIL
jgi:hypothetical protein